MEQLSGGTPRTSRRRVRDPGITKLGCREPHAVWKGQGSDPAVRGRPLREPHGSAGELRLTLSDGWWMVGEELGLHALVRSCPESLTQEAAPKLVFTSSGQLIVTGTTYYTNPADFPVVFIQEMLAASQLSGTPKRSTATPGQQSHGWEPGSLVLSCCVTGASFSPSVRWTDRMD